MAQVYPIAIKNTLKIDEIFQGDSVTDTPEVPKDHTPQRPPNSFRVILDLNTSGQRLDAILLKNLREQNQNIDLKNISRTTYKELFSSGKILIKGQRAKPSSTLAKGETFVDILGYKG